MLTSLTCLDGVQQNGLLLGFFHWFPLGQSQAKCPVSWQKKHFLVWKSHSLTSGVSLSMLVMSEMLNGSSCWIWSMSMALGSCLGGLGQGLYQLVRKLGLR